VGLAIAYTVTAGTSLAGAISAARASSSSSSAAAAVAVGPRPPPSRTALALGCAAFGLVFSAPLSLVPDFRALTWVSASGAVASAFYTTAAVIAAARVRAGGGPPGGRAPPPHTPLATDPAWTALAALGTVTFAFGGHVIVPEVQASLASPAAMGPAIWGAYAATGAAYAAVAASGAAAWGGAAAEDVLLSPGAGPPWLMAAANVAVLLHVAAGYQIFSQPIFGAVGRAWAARRAGAAGAGVGADGLPPGRSPAPSPAATLEGALGAGVPAAHSPTRRSAGKASPLGAANATTGGGGGGGRLSARGPGLAAPPRPRLDSHLVAARLSYVAATTAAAAALPFLADLMALIGAAVFTPLTFVLPPLFAVALAAAAAGGGGGGGGGGSGGPDAAAAAPPLCASIARAFHLAIAGGFTVAGGVCAVAAARGLVVRAGGGE
jgi:hypothetical protein